MRSHAGRIVGVQVVLGALCVVIFYLVQPHQGQAAVLAALAVVVPSLYYAWLMERTFNASRLLLHGVLKTISTLTLMAVAIAVFTVEPLGFFVTLVALQLAYLMPSVR